MWRNDKIYENQFLNLNGFFFLVCLFFFRCQRQKNGIFFCHCAAVIKYKQSIVTVYRYEYINKLCEWIYRMLILINTFDHISFLKFAFHIYCYSNKYCLRGQHNFFISLQCSNYICISSLLLLIIKNGITWSVLSEIVQTF